MPRNFRFWIYWATAKQFKQFKEHWHALLLNRRTWRTMLCQKTCARGQEKHAPNRVWWAKKTCARKQEKHVPNRAWCGVGGGGVFSISPALGTIAHTLTMTNWKECPVKSGSTPLYKSSSLTSHIFLTFLYFPSIFYTFVICKLLHHTSCLTILYFPSIFYTFMMASWLNLITHNLCPITCEFSSTPVHSGTSKRVCQLLWIVTVEALTIPS
jgi:hypothetical protein